MTGHIYLIRNLVNGKGYVGQTAKSVARRFTQHKVDARNGRDYLLYRAMRKYGEDKFVVSEIATCGVEFLDDLEQHYIEFLGTLNGSGHGYNATAGGRGSQGLHPSNETRDKMRIAKLGKKRGPHSEVHKQRISAALEGNKNGSVPCSQSKRDKISASQKGRLCAGRSKGKRGKSPSFETRNKISMAKYGKPWSDTRRATQAIRPYVCSEKTKAELSAKNKGKPWSEARWAAQTALNLARYKGEIQ